MKRMASLAVAVLVMALGPGQAQEGFEQSPFFDQTERVLQAHAIEMLSARLRGLSALAATTSEDMGAAEGGDEAEDDLGEIIEALDVDYRRFGATLQAQAPELFEDLRDALGALEDAHENGGDVAAAADRAAALVDEARQEVLGDSLESDPALAAAVMAMMLTTENGGIGEGYEEAVEGEVGPFAVGWAALARVEEMWTLLEPMANDTQRFEINDMFTELQVLFPSPRPGPEVERSDPEEAEGSTQRIGGFLEELTDADLFPSRDLGRLLSRIRDVSASACESYEGGNHAAGLESISNAAFVYGEYLGNTLALFSPEAANEAQASYDALSPGAMGEEEGEEEGGAEEPEEEEEDEPDPLVGDEAAEVCGELVEHLETAGAPFGI